MKTRPWVDVSELSQPADPDANDAVLAASWVLFVLSGQKYTGVFETTEQYVCEATGAPVGCTWDPGARAYWNPALGAYTYIQDPYVGLGSGRMTRLQSGSSIRLRQTPVVAISSITVGGSAVPSGSYELLNSSIVDPAGDNVTWSLCDSPIITYTYGVQPPALGKLACRKLADQILLSMQGSANCQLPDSVTSVTRQGISFEVLDPQEFLDKGRTGIYEVDLFIKVANPSGARKRPRVFSPDMPRPYRRR